MRKNKELERSTEPSEVKIALEQFFEPSETKTALAVGLKLRFSCVEKPSWINIHVGFFSCS